MGFLISTYVDYPIMIPIGSLEVPSTKNVLMFRSIFGYLLSRVCDERTSIWDFHDSHFLFSSFSFFSLTSLFTNYPGPLTNNMSLSLSTFRSFTRSYGSSSVFRCRWVEIHSRMSYTPRDPIPCLCSLRKGSLFPDDRWMEKGDLTFEEFVSLVQKNMFLNRG